MIHIALIILAFALSLWLNKVTLYNLLNPNFLGCTTWDTMDKGHSCLLSFVTPERVWFSFGFLSVILNLMSIPLYFL